VVATAAAVLPLGAPPAAALPALPDVLYDAHRGGSMEVRENSMSGFQAALDGGRVQVLDLDARMLKDGRVVVMHDPTVDRTSTATGTVASYTTEAWRQVMLDIGNWLPSPPPQEQAPTLARVLNRFGGEIRMSVEAKDADAVDTIAQMIINRSLTGSVYMNTNRPGVARHIHSLGIKAQLWRSARQMRTDDPTTFAPYADVLDADIEASDADFARFVASGVRQVWAHTLTTRAERDRALRLGATGIVTDDPAYLTGQTDTYPMPPTVIRVVTPPSRTQVSDAVTTEVVVAPISGPALREPTVTVSGRHVTLRRSSIGDALVRTLHLRTVGARVGDGPITLAVPRGSEGERRWTGDTARVALPLVAEDLQLRSRAATDGRRVRFRVRLLDSAARAYTGTRPETGSARTVAGLDRAALTLTVTRAGRTVFSTAFRGPGDGAADGDATTTLGWTAPRAGRYVVAVTQQGNVYRTVTTRRAFRVS
jgi:glycerophosphoryl diester phosphodiesterase